MAFKGDLKDINLADIFQTLAMNQQEGTLTIISGDKQTRIYFNKDGVRLLVSPEQKHIRLGELLLKKRKLTPVELDMALARQKMTGELLGQALIDMNVVTGEDILGTIRSQMEEDIYEIFSWKRATFEFTPGEPEAEFYDPAMMGNLLAFNVNSVIMEAARRIDEWDQIHRVIPFMSTIYLVRDPEGAIPDISNLGFSTKDIVQVVKLIDGRNTVEDIANQSPLGRFETCKIVAALVGRGYLNKLDPKETIRIAETLCAEGDGEGAIKIYKDALADQPMDISLRLRLAELYENEGKSTEASNEYAKTGHIFIRADSLEDGFALYRKATELAPKNYAVREQLFKHYYTAQKFDEAAGEGLVTARWYWRMNKPEQARKILELVVEISPKNVEAFQLLANIHMDLEQPDKALAKYEALAEVFKRSGEEEKLVECYRKMLTIEPKRADIRNKLNSLVSKKRKKAGRKGSRKLIYVVALVLVVIGAGAAYYALSEMSVRAEFNKIKRETDAALEGIKDDVISLEVRHELIMLRKRVEKWRDDNPYSLVVLKNTEVKETIDKLRYWEDKISKNLEARTEEKIERNKNLLRMAREAEENGNFVEALDLYTQIDTKVLPKQAPIIKDNVSSLRNYLDEARFLHEEALEDQKQAVAEMKPELWEKVHRKLRRLLEEYKNSPVVKEEIGQVCPKCEASIEETDDGWRCVKCDWGQKKVKLPLLVESNPGGAKVEIAGKEVGQTPHVEYREPGRLLRVKATKLGYQNPPFQTVKDPDWHAFFSLVKKPIWTFIATGDIESAPVTDGENVYFGTRAGAVYAVEIKTGNKAWSFMAQALNVFVASPMVDSGKLYIGSLSKNLYALGAREGKELWSMPLGSGIRSTPSAMSGGVFYIGCHDHKVYAIDSQTKTQVWQFETGKEVLSSPVLSGSTVYAGSNDRQFYALGAGSGKRVWSFKTLGPVTGRPGFYRDKEKGLDLVIVGSDDSAIYALHAAGELPEGQNRAAWTFPTGGAVSSTPFVVDDCIYATSGDGKLYCLDAATGQEKWSFDTDKSISASPIVVDGTVYFGDTDGYFWAVSTATRQEVWKFKTGGEILGGACVSGEYIIVGSTDSVLYCFIKD